MISLCVEKGCYRVSKCWVCERCKKHCPRIRNTQLPPCPEPYDAKRHRPPPPYTPPRKAVASKKTRGFKK